MPNKKRPAKDKQLQEFLKAGGRSGAEANFDAILKRAAKPSTAKKPQPKTK
jgi:hypothetical protein